MRITTEEKEKILLQICIVLGILLILYSVYNLYTMFKKEQRLKKEIIELDKRFEKRRQEAEKDMKALQGIEYIDTIPELFTKI